MIKYKIIDSEQECNECDALIYELLNYENKFDNLINNKHILKSFCYNKIQDKNCIIIGAMDDKKIIGLISANKSFAKHTTYNKYIITIENFYVKETYRRQGIGTNLLKNIDKWANKKFGDYALEIVSLNNNLQTQQLYASYGFTPTKIIFRKSQ